jgi:hypothetical protein
MRFYHLSKIRQRVDEFLNGEVPNVPVVWVAAYYHQNKGKSGMVSCFLARVVVVFVLFSATMAL